MPQQSRFSYVTHSSSSVKSSASFFVLLSKSQRHAENISSVRNCNLLLSDFLNFLLCGKYFQSIAHEQSFSPTVLLCSVFRVSNQNLGYIQLWQDFGEVFFTATYCLGINGNSSFSFSSLNFHFNFPCIDIIMGSDCRCCRLVLPVCLQTQKYGKGKS